MLHVKENGYLFVRFVFPKVLSHSFLEEHLWKLWKHQRRLETQWFQNDPDVSIALLHPIEDGKWS